MLALSRKEKESIILTVPPSTEPTEIEIVFVGWRAPKARLGFKAPQCVEILRSELRSAWRRARQPVEPHDGDAGATTGANVDLLAACKAVIGHCESEFIDPEEMAPEWVDIYKELQAAVAKAERAAG